MELAQVAEASQRLATTRSRKAKIDILGTCLKQFSSAALPLAVAYLSGDLARARPGLGPANLRRTRGVSPATAPTLSLADVDATLARITAVTGKGAQSKRDAHLRGLLKKATELEQSFLQRLILGDLRQGALAGMMVEAVAQATGVPAAAMRRAAMVTGDLPAVAALAREGGARALEDCRLRPLQPVQPMLAQTVDTVAAALADLGECGLEYKLDGVRVQLHKAGDEVRVFSRRLNDMTAAVPELVELGRQLPARNLVLDGEAIALTPAGSPRPFQVTMRRFGRKAKVTELRSRLPLSVFYFDCLLRDDEDLTQQPWRRRVGEMEAVLPPAQQIPRLITTDALAGQDFLTAALERGHEGVMVKAVGAPYEAGSRGANWLKLKPAHTLDLLVLAAEWGSGRRVGWLSNLHLGACDPASGQPVMLGKTFKGLTDDLLRWQTEQLSALATHTEGRTVYVRPELVVEVAFDGVQASPHYPAGLALRFARVLRYRTDKTASETDSLDAVRALFRGASHEDT